MVVEFYKMKTYVDKGAMSRNQYSETIAFETE